MNQETVLIVEDEQGIADLLVDYLKSYGYNTQHFTTAEGVLEWLHNNKADCVLLDIMLPEADCFGDGLDLCRSIRRFSQVPIMMVTARIEEIDRILGLELGADDYLCKPFSPREAIARVKALVRRGHYQKSSPQISPWKLDEQRYQVHYHNEKVELSAVEFEIMRTLSRSPGQIFSRAQLIEKIYHDHRVVSDRTIDSHIKKLRQKLVAAFGDNEWVQSVYGIGYRFILEETETAVTE